jgi:hypothetical protein
MAVYMSGMGPFPGDGSSALPRICTLWKRWLAMVVCSASDIPAFMQHATIQIFKENIFSD